MRICEIRIANFRAIREFHLTDIPDLVVLAGPNGTGKSTVLEAIALWKEAVAPYYSQRPATPDAVSGDASAAEITITLEVAANEIESLSSEVKTEPSLNPLRVTAAVQIQRTGEVTCKVTDQFPNFSALLRRLDRELPLGIMEYIGPYRRLPSVEIQAIPLTPITPERERLTRLYDVESKFNEVKQYLIALEVQDWQRYYHDDGTRQDSSKPIKDLFGVFFSPKRLLGAQSVDTPQGPRLKLGVETPAGIHDLDNLSSGEKEILMVFATLQRLRLRNSIILYDEPELHLNASLERKVIPELSRLGEGNQIWVATHSVEIIDLTPLENLFILSHYAGENQVSRASNDRDRINLFQCLGASTGLQLISDRVVFIEGEQSSADKELLKQIFADHSRAVTFVPTGNASTLEWVGKCGIELWAEASRHGEFFLVRDKDFLSKERIAALKADLQGRVWIWDRYHVENYLLNPVAIHRALIRAGIRDYATPQAIEADLKKLADDLRDEVVARWAGAMLNQELGWQNYKITGGSDPVAQLLARSQAALTEATKHLGSEAIQNLINKLRSEMNTWDAGLWREITPGKRLLRLFAGNLKGGLSYERLRSLILAEMRDDRALWPKEFTELIDTVLGITASPRRVV